MTTQNKSSRFIGVDFHKITNKFRAQIKIKGKKYHIGLFKTEDEAHDAYLEVKNNTVKFIKS